MSALQKRRPDLILSDFSLPHFDGIRALDLAVTYAPETPFIYVSGTIGEERAIEALRRGATDYVLKTNLARLSPAVERALREASLRYSKAKSERQQQEQGVRLQRLTRTYRMLSSMSSAILRLRNRIELLDEVCRIGVHQGGYERVSISLVNPGTNTLRPQASAGSGTGHEGAADPVKLDPGAQTDLAERALASGSPAVLNDLADSPESLAQNKAWIVRGYRAVAALPLFIDGTAIGVINLYSAQNYIFDEAEVGVLLELTANLGFALQYLEKDEAVHFLSYFDSLTGLAKRPLFCQRLGHLVAADRGDGGSTVVVFDVQKLGAINDTLGRYVGDRLIEGIAARLKQTFVEPDRVAYFGGGTFAVMLEGGTNKTDTARILHNPAAQAFVEPFKIDGQELRPTIRSGVAFHPTDGVNADALVQNAEAALKAAREDGEKYMLYGLITQRPTSRSLALEARLAGALDRQEFLLHYQPEDQYRDRRGRGTRGASALAGQRRWFGGAFFVRSLAGAIRRHRGCREWVLLQAVRDIRKWTMAGLPGMRVAVNVSPLQLRRRDFVQRVLSGIEPTMQMSAGVDIEITESMLMHDLELSIRKLSQLREARIGVAIDDFGTGYSSLRLLARLPVDTLKIDRSFMHSITDTPNVMTLVSTVVSLARAFGMRTVAEGVETSGQLEMLRLCKCDQAQGFYFARPVPALAVQSEMARLSQRRPP